MPFPTVQGTQAAIAAIIGALAGREVALLTYAHGDPALSAPPIEHLRIARTYADRSLRSGPSIAKLAQDLALARAIARRAPARVVAHHVEACAASLLAGAPTIFVAHTALGPELPTYFSGRAAWLERAGDALEAALARRAQAILAVSPALAARLAALTGREVTWLPIPWPIAPPIDREERELARRALGIDPEDEVVLYAGNLDRYQGLPELFDAIRALARPRLRLLLATNSRDPIPADLAIVRVALGDESVRRKVHAAADLAAIPRAIEGGLPIKMIDAMARGLAVAAVERASAGLAIDGAIAIGALGPEIRSLLEDRERRMALAESGRAWVARELCHERFLAAYDRALWTAGSPGSTSPAR